MDRGRRRWLEGVNVGDVLFKMREVKEPGLYDPEHLCGFNWSDTVVVGVKSGYRMSRVPYSKEWCWLTL